MALDRERASLWGLDSGLDGRVRGTGRGADAAEAPDPMLEAANIAGAPTGYEDIDGVRHAWFRKDLLPPGSEVSIPTAGRFERDGKFYVPEATWAAAHPAGDDFSSFLEKAFKVGIPALMTAGIGSGLGLFGPAAQAGFGAEAVGGGS